MRMVGILVCALAGCGGTAQDPDTAMSVFEALEEAWREPDPVRRLGLLQIAITDDIQLYEPDNVETNREDYSAHIGAYLAAYPGGSIPLTSAVVQHHARAWYRWSALDGQNGELAAGDDYVRLGVDGRIARIYSLFDGRTASRPAAIGAFEAALSATDPTQRRTAVNAAFASGGAVVIDEDGIATDYSEIDTWVGQRAGALTLMIGDLVAQNGYRAMTSTGRAYFVLADDGKIAELALFSD